MTLVFAETDRAIPLVSMTVALRAGAVHEPPERAGLARIAARMLRRGCRGLSSDELESRIDSLGAELGTSAGLVSTMVHVELLARSAPEVARLLGRLLAHPSFDQAELDRLKRQTEAEITESRDSDAFLAGRAFRRQLFAGHPHSRRVAGTIATVGAIERQDVERWHRAHFVRENAVVVVVGNLSEEAVAELSEAVTAELPSGRATPYPATEPVPPDGRNLVLVDKPERTQTQMVIGTLGTHPRDRDHTALLVANTAFGGTFTARMVQEIRAKRGWSYGASSHLSTGRVREAFSMWAAPAAGDTAACLRLELEMLSRWREDGISAEELAFCKSYLRRSYAFEIETAKKRAAQWLDRALLDLPEDYHHGFVERVEAVTLEDANAAIGQRIDDGRLWMSLVCTEADLGAELRQAVDRLGDVVVVPYDLE
ncbi:MAG: insulinase family protein [Deltaproteobacteria bacterium]|jgi:zinc protease|nr:insulinase family protein [Deltaproteobacteria bacterium]MBW2537691.1 insulinase family protein [Deltaproteobacteria bacterium]